MQYDCVDMLNYLLKDINFFATSSLYENFGNFEGYCKLVVSLNLKKDLNMDKVKC